MLSVSNTTVETLEGLGETIQRAWPAKQLRVRSGSGSTDTLQVKVRKAEQWFAADRDNAVLMHPAAAESLGLTPDTPDVELDKASKARLSAIRKARAQQPRLPRTFTGALRECQREGFVWLARLCAAGLAQASVRRTPRPPRASPRTRALDRLRAILEPFMLRRRRSEALTDAIRPDHV